LPIFYAAENKHHGIKEVGHGKRGVDREHWEQQKWFDGDLTIPTNHLYHPILAVSNQNSPLLVILPGVSKQGLCPAHLGSLFGIFFPWLLILLLETIWLPYRR
jgi:hypothetical protein